jgi:hypothetical protein
LRVAFFLAEVYRFASAQAADTAGGYNSDLVAAIDQGVADGVDAINDSISGTLTNLAQPTPASLSSIPLFAVAPAFHPSINLTVLLGRAPWRGPAAA